MRFKRISSGRSSILKLKWMALLAVIITGVTTGVAMFAKVWERRRRW